jgi:hypothetical protein
MLKNLYSIIAITIICALGACSGGCSGTAQRAGSAVGNVAASTIDCLAPTAAQAVATFAPALATVVRSATSPDGHVDWAPIKDTAVSLKTPAAQCVLASVIKEALAPPKESAAAPQSSPAALDVESLTAGWEEQRAAWGGARYQLAGGVL